MSFAFAFSGPWPGTIFASLALYSVDSGVLPSHSFDDFDIANGTYLWTTVQVDADNLSIVNGRLYCDEVLRWHYVPDPGVGDTWTDPVHIGENWQVCGVIFTNEADEPMFFIDGPGFPFTPRGQRVSFDPSGTYIADFAV